MILDFTDQDHINKLNMKQKNTNHKHYKLTLLI